MSYRVPLWAFLLTTTPLLHGCGGQPDFIKEDSTFGGQPSAGEGGTDGGGNAGEGGSGDQGPVQIAGKGNTSSSAGSAGQAVDPCDLMDCGSGQRCEVDGDEASCVDNECDDLGCSATEECVPVESGGNRCESIACDEDVDCPIDRYCDGEVCVDDACEAEARSCDGDDLFICASNGSEDENAYTCDSAGYFESVCDDSDPGRIGCVCEDDWDCPEFTVCEAAVCVGTGREPTCTLPPPPFEEVLPALEFRWGGESSTDQDATSKAFPWSSQVLSTPLVVNLDDDNGDGLVNELDFPELVFMSYPPGGNSPAAFLGTLRAVHGGGPAKGEDFFATCGVPVRPDMPEPSYTSAVGAYWSEGEPLIEDCGTGGLGDNNRNAAIGRAAGALAVGDLDNDGLPEIVMPTTDSGNLSGIAIFTNRGEFITSAPEVFPAQGFNWNYAAPAIANLDFDGLAEIVVGNRVVVLSDEGGELSIDRVVAGDATVGAQAFNSNLPEMGPSVCLADLDPDLPGLEIVAGPSLYRFDPSADELTLLWDSSGDTGIENPDGFCAVADVLGEDELSAPGPDNPLDGVAEVILISDGQLVVLRAVDGEVLRVVDLDGGNVGGAPNVDDFDGDGFPEIATALQDFYTVIDLQEPSPDNCPAWPDVLPQTGTPPGTNDPRDPGGACDNDDDCEAGTVCNEIAGQCVCLHSGWKRDTEDDSSRATSSSIFDFNGDGAAEVVYNDECYFRVYDGSTGEIYLAIPSLSRTIIENPVVADVDNDGNSEILFVQNNEFLQCSETNLDSWPDGDNDVPRASLPNGIEVWGDPSDSWVAARRIWNQHSYHVTNVTESGAIPLHEPESWRVLNGRLYNSYRSQPRNYNVAPDLVLPELQISSPDQACGELSDEIEISVKVENQGDLRVGPGVVVEFFGEWQSDPELSAALEDSNGDPITVTLGVSLEPGASTLVTVSYEAGNNDRDDLPDQITVVIDGANAERECVEDNNDVSGPVDAGEALADISLEIDDADGCDPAEVELTVTNDGSLAAEEILVEIYAGDPSAGGTMVAEVTIDGPLEPGESETVTVEAGSFSRDVVIWAVADPDDTIEECNDANNIDQGPRLQCDEVVR